MLTSTIAVTVPMLPGFKLNTVWDTYLKLVHNIDYKKLKEPKTINVPLSKYVELTGSRL